MMKFYICIFIFLAPAVSAVKADDDMVYFSSKTSYFPNANYDDSTIDIDECKPILFWNLARHGSRNPGDKEIEDMLRLPEIRDQITEAWLLGQTSLTEDEFVGFLEWTLDLTVDQAYILSESGEKEHTEMGARWRNRLQGLVDISESSTKVRSSSKQRCRESGRTFAEGFFNTENIPDIEINDNLTRNYEQCPKWLEEVEGNSQTYIESDKFEASDNFKSLIERVSIKSGLNLPLEDVNLIWNICRYESAIYPDRSPPRSPWCSLLSPLDLELFNFREDLKYYYADGFAYEVTRMMTQPLMADLVDSLKEAAAGSSDTNVILNFGHTDTVQPFMTALGLYRDPSMLLASDYPSAHQYNVSKIGSFASNIGVVLMDCSSDLNVALFHQEQLVATPDCGESVLCPLEIFLNKNEMIADLDFQSVCAL